MIVLHKSVWRVFCRFGIRPAGLLPGASGAGAVSFARFALEGPTSSTFSAIAIKICFWPNVVGGNAKWRILSSEEQMLPYFWKTWGVWSGSAEDFLKKAATAPRVATTIHPMIIQHPTPTLSSLYYREKTPPFREFNVKSQLKYPQESSRTSVVNFATECDPFSDVNFFRAKTTWLRVKMHGCIKMRYFCKIVSSALSVLQKRPINNNRSQRNTDASAALKGKSDIRGFCGRRTPIKSRIFRQKFLRGDIKVSFSAERCRQTSVWMLRVQK